MMTPFLEILRLHCNLVFHWNPLKMNSAFWLRRKGGALPGALGRQAWRCFRSPSHHWSRCRHDKEVRNGIETARIGAEHGQQGKSNKGPEIARMIFDVSWYRVEILLVLRCTSNVLRSFFKSLWTSTNHFRVSFVGARPMSAKDFQGQKLCGLGRQRQQKGLASPGPVCVSWRLVDLPPGFGWLLCFEASISEPFPHFPSVFHTSLVALCQVQKLLRKSLETRNMKDNG